MAYTYHLSNQSSNQPAEKTQVSTHLPARSAGRCPHETNTPTDSHLRHISKTPISRLRALAAAALLLLAGTAAWGQSLTVNDGTNTSSYIPMYGLYFDDYTKSECVIPSSLLTGMPAGSTITAMTFYVSSANTGAWDNTNQKVFLKEVAGTSLGGNYSGMGGATIVFDGQLPLPTTTGAYTINFTTSYTYSGGNLLIGVYNDDDGTFHGISWYGTTGNATGCSAYGSNGTSLANVGYTQLNFLPKVTFLYPCHPSFSNTTDYITNITIGSINNTTGFSTGGYGSYTNLSTDILQGAAVNLSLTSSAGSGNHGAAVWIDFNDNGEFETSERVGTYTNSIQPNTTVQIPLTIPADAALGSHVMRVVYRYNTDGTSIAPCVSSTYGEGEDYTVNIIQPCNPTFSSTTDYITNITLGSINNSTGFSTGGYGNYTGLSTTVARGNTATLSLTSSAGSGNHGAAVWIDFNDDGVFQASELVGTYPNSIGASATVQITLTIPADAAVGSHVMRVVYQYNTAGTSIDPCVSASYGEGEDYTVNIISCTNRDGHVKITSGCGSTITSGQTTTLIGAVDGGYGGGDASWSSSDDAIATVSNSGVVTAKAPGTVTITYTRAEDGTYCAASYNCDITVNCATNTQTFAFSTTTGTVAEDASINISGNLTVPTGATVTSYTSDNTGVATVTNAGVVTGVSAGTAHITATIAQWTYNDVTYCERTTTNSFTVTVTGDGCTKVGTAGLTTSGNYAPIFGNWKNSWVEMIYPAAEIGECCMINSIAFKSVNTNNTYTHETWIYLGLTDKTAFSSSTDYVSSDDMTEMYHGNWVISEGWNTFVFDEPFDYDDCDKNLIIGMLCTADGWNSTTFYYTTTTGYSIIAGYSDDYVPDPADMSSWSDYNTYQTYRPDIKICKTCCTHRDDAAHITNACPIDLPYGTTVQLGGSVDVGAGDASWTSSNGDAATVNGSGLVSAVNMGATTITYARAYDGTYCPTKATCVVNVVVPTPTVTQTDDPLPECGDGNATLVASVPRVPTGYVYHWYSNSTCTTEITTGVSGTNNNTLSIAATNGGQVWCRLEKAGSTTSQTFNYSGDIQTYTVPADAESLTLEVWGAQGGSYNATYSGGKGGYSKGTLASPTAGSTLYVVVGGQPAAYTTIPSSSTNTTIPGGYNGGGNAVVHYYSSNYSLPQGGGGATHIATSSGLLSTLSALQDNVLIVAGGGSGGVYFNNGSTSGFAGYAGGGATSNGYTGGTYTYTANQTAAGNGGAFGQGASPTGGYNYKYGPSGGGGGWYGGGSYTYSDTYGEELVRGHGGGSGYIKSTLTATSSSNGSQSGNGQAKITAVIPTLTGLAGTVTLKCCGIDAEINISAP